MHDWFTKIPVVGRKDALAANASATARVVEAQDLFVSRPAVTLEDAITAEDAHSLAQWAKYLRGCHEVSSMSVLDLGQVVEDIGYALTGHRYSESESVWNAVAELARQQGHADRVEQVEATYQVHGFHPIISNSKGIHP
ncbi:hypothetical protein [Mycolicibacterium llatzerense]|uniref:hypothetical protein n=1 Tax=Mycolicibacterium llatzerense TaxID=280871 RepID=UPI0008DE2D4C|nr:hypothetical protein [Mycolicibacterium llatzerense]